MPFRTPTTKIYAKVIKPVVISKGLECKRADDYKTNKEIMKDIWSAICQSHVVIADMTGFNPNVMYELGISHTVGKETIMMIQHKSARTKQNFPFDMSHIRKIEYQNTARGYLRLKLDLSRTLQFVLEQLPKEPYYVKTKKTESEQENDESHYVTVDEQEEKDGVRITVRSVDYAVDVTDVFIKIENGTEREISIYPRSSYAKQGTKQVRYIRSLTQIRNRIPPGVVEEGYIAFEPIDYRKGNMVFYFVFSDDLRLGIEVDLG
jgi:hypothetical protein